MVLSTVFGKRNDFLGHYNIRLTKLSSSSLNMFRFLNVKDEKFSPWSF